VPAQSSFIRLAYFCDRTYITSVEIVNYNNNNNNNNNKYNKYNNNTQHPGTNTAELCF